MVWTVPNALTLLRVVLVPVFLWFVTRDTLAGSVLALLTFTVAGITDTLDGYIARKYGSITDIGRFLDPLADKLLVLSVFYWAAIGVGASHAWFNIWLVHLIAVREIVITTLRTVRRRQGTQIMTASEGRLKTVMQIVTVATVLTFEAASRVMASFDLPSLWINSGAVWLLVQLLFAIALALTVLSGIRYFTVHSGTVPLQENRESG